MNFSRSIGTVAYDSWSSPVVKSSKANVVARFHKIPDVLFEDAEGQKLTSFGGLVLYQALFDRLDFKAKLRRCFAVRSSRNS
jgi:hypothetical protein